MFTRQRVALGWYPHVGSALAGVALFVAAPAGAGSRSACHPGKPPDVGLVLGAKRPSLQAVPSSSSSATAGGWPVFWTQACAQAQAVAEIDLAGVALFVAAPAGRQSIGVPPGRLH